MYKIIDEHNDLWGEYDDEEQAMEAAMDMFYFNESFNIINHLTVVDEKEERLFNTKELYEQVY